MQNLNVTRMAEEYNLVNKNVMTYLRKEHGPHGDICTSWS